MGDYHEDLVGDHRKITLHGDYYACTAARDKRRRHQWSVVKVDALDPGFAVIMKCLACGVPALEAKYGWYTIHSIAQLLGQGWHIPDPIRTQLSLPPAPMPVRRKPWAHRLASSRAVTATLVAVAAVAGCLAIGAGVCHLEATFEANCQATKVEGVVHRVTWLRGCNNNDFRLAFEDGRHADVDLEDGDEIPVRGTRVRVCERDHCHVVPVDAPKAKE